MQYFIIDGNNLIGKISDLKALQQKEPQASREQLVLVLDKYFSDKKQKVYLHFDGFSKEPIRTIKLKIVYSDEKTADDKIRAQIERAKNPKLYTIVTSDRALGEFAKVCSCEVIKSEKFARMLKSAGSKNSEQEIISKMSVEEFKKLFNAE